MNFDEDADFDGFQQAAQGHTVSDHPTPDMPPPSAREVADAFERRLRQQREEREAQVRAQAQTYAAFDEDHARRQEFRRLVDPGILRPNPRALALEALQTLLKLAENILEHPDEEKYQRFKSTNPTIKRLLVDPKGTIEYARALGFNPHVDHFQPFYVFNKKRHMSDLQIGAEILRETLEREITKEERTAMTKKEEKAIAAAHIANIKLQFLDDRKSQAAQARREREVRHAPAVRLPSNVSPATSPTPSAQPMPGSGHTLRDGSTPVD